MSAPTPVIMPRLGETLVEGTVSRWFKAPGENVTKLEPLLAISTDKIDTEVPAPATGVLLEIRVAEGATVDAGTVLALIGTPGDVQIQTERSLAQSPAAPLQHAHMDAPAAPSPALSPQSSERPAGRLYVSPVVRRLMREHAVDLTAIEGTGLGGRITKKDFLAHLELSRLEMDTGEPAMGDEILHVLTPMRRAIAQHMVQSVRTSPHVATIFEVDMTAVVRHREAHRAAMAARNIKLTYTSYFVAAAAAALRSHPLVNSRYSEAGIVHARRVHVGVAVALADGLIVPVIRDADERSLEAVAGALQDLAARARDGTLTPDDLQGGTFTITNHGVGGSLIGTPIINQPQAAILGVGAIVKRPIVQSSATSLLPSADDVIAIRPMCYLTLSFDHRILDGATADAFVRSVKAGLERWASD